jgi:hypothetical protein
MTASNKGDFGPIKHSSRACRSILRLGRVPKVAGKWLGAARKTTSPYLGTHTRLPARKEGGAPPVATFVDEDFQPQLSVRIDGIPARARISPGGRYAAFTVFVSGHSYGDSSLSTTTLLLDMNTGSTVADLESFQVLQEGNRIRSPEFNYWSISFLHDSNIFSARHPNGGVNFSFVVILRPQRSPAPLCQRRWLTSSGSLKKGS